MTTSRNHGDVLCLLDPDQLPVDRDSLARAATTLTNNRVDDRLLHAPEPERHRARDLLVSDRLVHRTLASSRVSPHLRENCDEHDRHFGVVRVHGDAGTIFLASLMISYLDMLDNVERAGTSLDRGQWSDLLRVPTLAFDFALRRSPSMIDGPGRVPPGRGEYLPHERWHIGHRLFFTLIQATTQALTSLLRAARVGDGAGMEECMTLARFTVLGSAAALPLAADFEPVDYENGVRRTMLPPYVGPGFSGLQTRDHHHLIHTLVQLRSIAPAMDSISESYAEFTAAVHRLYDAHAFVCARFGGDKVPSLRMAAARRQIRRSGVEVVRGFAARRVSLLEPTRPVNGEV